MLTMFLKVHTQTHPLRISPAPPQLCQGQEGPIQAKAHQHQEGWSLASAVATWAPSAGKVSASSLGVTSLPRSF